MYPMDNQMQTCSCDKFQCEMIDGDRHINMRSPSTEEPLVFHNDIIETCTIRVDNLVKAITEEK